MQRCAGVWKRLMMTRGTRDTRHTLAVQPSRSQGPVLRGACQLMDLFPIASPPTPHPLPNTPTFQGAGHFKAQRPVLVVTSGRNGPQNQPLRNSSCCVVAFPAESGLAITTPGHINSVGSQTPGSHRCNSCRKPGLRWPMLAAEQPPHHLARRSSPGWGLWEDPPHSHSRSVHAGE